MVQSISPESTVAEAALSNPGATRLFESLGIDYCCGGRRTIRDAATTAGIEPEVVLQNLQKLPDATHHFRDWTQAPLAELVRHIVDKHHFFIRTETPRIEGLLAKVISKHGPSQPYLAEARNIFIALSQELATHLMKEEQIVFPYVSQLDSGLPRGGRFDSMAQPIERMFEEHDDAGELLAAIRRITDNFTLPAGACPAFAALYQGLQEFEQDLHQHIHLENNILFPKAIAAERTARQ